LLEPQAVAANMAVAMNNTVSARIGEVEVITVSSAISCLDFCQGACGNGFAQNFDTTVCF